MFEVEVKFKVNQKQKQLLTDSATFISTEKFQDIYYDTITYGLSLNDRWLRSRNGCFMLKIPIKSVKKNLLDLQKNTPKREIENLEEIKTHLALKAVNTILPFEEVLLSSGFQPLYVYENIREKYEKRGLIIDFDTALWKGHTFSVCEIEKIVENESDIDETLKHIEEFAHAHGLTVEPIEARLIEIIKRQNPEHYKKLTKTYS
jgi:predicted adenylyl cyclase CyaB